jgi:hypothetical protein
MKKMMWVMPAIALFLASCGGGKKDAAGVVPGDAVSLKLNLKPGEQFNQNMKVDMDINSEAMGQKINMKMGFDAGMKFAVSTTDSAGSMNMNMTYTALDANIDMGALAAGKGGEMNTMMKKIMGALVGETITVTMNKNGELTGTGGFEAIKANLTRKADSLGLPEASIDQIVEGFAQKNLDGNLKMMFNIYPDKPVKPGDTWVKETTQEVNNINMKMKNEYTLTKVNGGVAYIALKSSAVGKGEMKQAGQNMEVDIDLTQKGTLEMNMSNGTLKGGKADMKMDGTINAMGMKMPMKVNAVYTITN